jgi:hypothetical protein
MPFRDDRDAMLARNEALERKAAEKERRLADKRARLAEAEGRAKAAEKERDALARKVRRLQPKDADQARPQRMILAAGAGLALVGGLVAVLVQRGAEVAPATEAAAPAPAVAAQPAPSADALAAERRGHLQSMRIAFDRTDPVLRLMLRSYPGASADSGALEWWRLPGWFNSRTLDDIPAVLRQAVPADPALDDAALAVADAMVSLTPILEELWRYLERGEHLDDEGARWRDREPALREAAAAYLAAADTLRERLAAHAADIYVGRPGEELAFAAWGACGAVVDAITAGAVDPSGLGVGVAGLAGDDRGLGDAVDACAAAADALREQVRDDAARRHDYVLGLFDSIVARGKQAGRSEAADELTQSLTSLAQVHGYAGMQFARWTRTAGALRR